MKFFLDELQKLDYSRNCFGCFECNKEFSHEDKLQRRCCNSKIGFVCEFYHKKFTTNGNINRHYQTRLKQEIWNTGVFL